MRVLRCGELALLVEFDRDEDVLATAAAIRAAAGDPATSGSLGEVDELVPAQRTLLVRCRPSAALASVATTIAALRPTELGVTVGDDVGIDVVYDGADLDDVAALTGRSRDDVVATHTGTVWTVAFCGFAPGFGYLRAPGDPLGSGPAVVAANQGPDWLGRSWPAGTAASTRRPARAAGS